MEVKLMLLSQAAFHSPHLPPNLYNAYDILVEGRINRIATSATDALTFVLTNKYLSNPIRYAYITTPDIHDITTLIDPNETPRATAKLQTMYATRGVWLDPEAVVITCVPHVRASGTAANPPALMARTHDKEVERHGNDVGTAVTDIRRMIGYYPAHGR